MLWPQYQTQLNHSLTWHTIPAAHAAASVCDGEMMKETVGPISSVGHCCTSTCLSCDSPISGIGQVVSICIGHCSTDSVYSRESGRLSWLVHAGISVHHQLPPIPLSHTTQCVLPILTHCLIIQLPLLQPCPVVGSFTFLPLSGVKFPLNCV